MLFSSMVDLSRLPSLSADPAPRVITDHDERLETEVRAQLPSGSSLAVKCLSTLGADTIR